MNECSVSLLQDIVSSLTYNTTHTLASVSQFLAFMELDNEVTHSDLTFAEPWFASDTSSGYLEDAITGTGILCRQHNLTSYSQNQMKSQCMVDQKDLFPSFSSTKSHLHQDHKKISTKNLSSSSRNHKHAAAIKHDSSQRSCTSRESNENDASILRGQWKIAYPFELVKPGGIEGETTLKDINHQMLMNPSKPIPHPVGDSVTHQDRGYSISGKAVAALTRIHTQGRGSITIIRTKG